MAVALHDRPRAYVAAPVAPATGLFQAINWAFEQDTDLIWGDLGILVTDRAMIPQLSHLHRLQARGVRIGTAEQAARARSFHGMVIAYCPGVGMLADAESLPGVRGVAVVALHNEPLLQWVTACAPQHLGGQLLATPPRATAAAPGPGTLQPST